MLREYTRRYKRYIVYFLRWLCIEKPKGLDFSMRCKTRKIRRPGNHGYALSPQSAVNDMLDVLNITKDDCFLDIGCGKGGVLYFASRKPFGRIAGIEVEPFLYEIACKNIKKLGLENEIELFLDDAAEFKFYNKFNVFYLFNPFDVDIYIVVLNIIFNCIRADQMVNKNVWLLCYGATTSETIEQSGLFNLVKKYTDSYRGSTVHIWKSKTR